MSRPMTASKPLDLKLLQGLELDRFDLDATPYVLRVATEDGLIERTGKKSTRGAFTYKLTAKGRRRAKK